jgi:hypothetical protein
MIDCIARQRLKHIHKLNTLTACSSFSTTGSTCMYILQFRNKYSHSCSSQHNPLIALSVIGVGSPPVCRGRLINVKNGNAPIGQDFSTVYGLTCGCMTAHTHWRKKKHIAFSPIRQQCALPHHQFRLSSLDSSNCQSLTSTARLVGPQSARKIHTRHLDLGKR